MSRQNVDLRERLHEEASIYRRRLDMYRQAQQDQAALVSRLQAKVILERNIRHNIVDNKKNKLLPKPTGITVQTKMHRFRSPNGR